MKLRVKFLKWSAGIPLAMLHKDTAAKLGVQTKGRISLKTFSKYAREFYTIINTSEGLVRKNEIIVSSEIIKKMKLKKGQFLEINLAESPESLSYIKKKLNNKTLSKLEIREIVADIVNNQLSEADIALFITSLYSRGMTSKETTYLIKAFLKYGNTLKLKKKFIVDKHCIGGIPGNRTTPIVVSICSATGLIMPKSSSKAITSAAGTADTMEVLSPVAFTMEKLKKILKKTNAFIVWGGSVGMVPADAEIIRIEKNLKIDPEAQMLASIMSKKLAVGSNYILIDIPYGKNAKVNYQDALKLKTKFEKMGKIFHKKMEVLLTKGDEPIGNGIGPVLEMIDILKILNPAEKGPSDLKKKSIFLAGKLLEMTGKAKKGKGTKKAEEILVSGKAFKKFKEIVKAQGGHMKKLKPGKFEHNILAKKTGKIIEINNKKINLLARSAGCPADKSSGIYIYFHKGNKVKKGEKILTIYSESKSRLNSALSFYKKNGPLKIK